MALSRREGNVESGRRRSVGGTTGAGGMGVAGTVMALLALAVSPVGFEAQDREEGSGRIAFEARGGMAVPVGPSSLAAVTEPGASFGGSVSVRLTRHLFLTGMGGYHLLEANEEDAGAPVPGMNVLSAIGGVEYHFVEPGNPWNAVLSLGGGVANLETEEALDDGTPATIRLDATALAFRGGLKLAYQATPSVNLFVEPGVYVMLLDEELTEPYVVVAPGVDDTFSTNWLLPFQAGVRLQL